MGFGVTGPARVWVVDPLGVGVVAVAAVVLHALQSSGRRASESGAVHVPSGAREEEPGSNTVSFDTDNGSNEQTPMRPGRGEQFPAPGQHVDDAAGPIYYVSL